MNFRNLLLAVFVCSLAACSQKTEQKITDWQDIEKDIQTKLIMAEDVKKIMEQFSFENNRVDFAKFVYPKVYDQQNFYRVYDAFEFDSSINEMQRWLKR